MNAELSVPGSATRRDVLRTGALAAGAVVGGAALVGAVAPAAFAASRDIPTGGAQYWMHLDGINGFSTVRGHERDVPLTSLSWGVGVAISNAGASGGAQASKPAVSEVALSFVMGPESVPLLALLVAGDHLDKVELIGEATGNGGQPQEFLRYTLEGVQVSGWQSSAADSVPAQSVSLHFRKMTVKYAYSNGNDAPEELVVQP